MLLNYVTVIFGSKISSCITQAYALFGFGSSVKQQDTKSSDFMAHPVTSMEKLEKVNRTFYIYTANYAGNSNIMPVYT